MSSKVDGDAKCRQLLRCSELRRTVAYLGTPLSAKFARLAFDELSIIHAAVSLIGRVAGVS